jgi:glutathione S-transferase
MYKLYHYPLCPFSRKIRFLLAYFNVPFCAIEERIWERRHTFLKISPAGTVPVLVKKNGLIYPHSYLITDYLISTYQTEKTVILPNEEVIQLNAKKIAMWFDEKFWKEVSGIFIEEKVINAFKPDEAPNVAALAAARHNFPIHLDFLEYLLSQHTFLAGEIFTLADVTAAAHISSLDYLSEIKWSGISPIIKDWYSIIKSKLAFRELLEDTIPNINPSITYEAVDF